MRPSLFGSGCRCLPAPSCSEPPAHTDVRLRQPSLPAEARSQRPVLQRYRGLDSHSYDCSTLCATASSTRPHTGRTRTPTSRRSGPASTTRSRRSRRRARRWTWAPRRWSASTASSPPPSLRRWPTKARCRLSPIVRSPRRSALGLKIDNSFYASNSPLLGHDARLDERRVAVGAVDVGPRDRHVEHVGAQREPREHVGHVADALAAHRH